MMTRPRLLDLFGGEGLASLGYALAGFDVTAVEIDPDRIANHVRHPHVTVVEGDATTYPLDGFDVVAGSPPCTDHTTLAVVAEQARGGAAGTGWMLGHTIARCQRWAAESGGLYVIENVEGARYDMPNPMKLCGSMFNLTDGGYLLRRHRYFASNVLLMTPGPCRCHGRKSIGVYGDADTIDDRVASSLARRAKSPQADLRAGKERARRLMGAPWASPRGLSLGIPPAYTQFIGEQLMTYLSAPSALAA